MTGRSAVHVIGQAKAPGVDVGRLGSDPTYNPQNFFKQSSKLGVNPMREVMMSGVDGPDAPDKDEKGKKKKKKKGKGKSSKAKKDAKKKKKKKGKGKSSKAKKD